MKRFLFRNYWWITLLGGSLGVALVLRFAAEDRISLLGSVVATVLAFCYFVHQQKLAETTLFKDLFTEFNRRYDALNDRLAGIVESGQARDADRQVVVDYFNLCGEEYLFFEEGYIHPEVWRSWCCGMLWYFEREPFRTLWQQESATDSYYGLSLEDVRRGAKRRSGAPRGDARGHGT